MSRNDMKNSVVSLVSSHNKNILLSVLKYQESDDRWNHDEDGAVIPEKEKEQVTGLCDDQTSEGN